MLGFYENFPANVHKIVHLTTTVSKKKLQQAIIQAFHRLNSENLSLEAITKPSIPECTVFFEFGIAESEAFNYLDCEETQKTLERVRRTPLEVMDFFCAIRYYVRRSGRNKPLKFDYYMLRLAFNANVVEMYVFHERGPRHVSPEDVIKFVVDKVNELFPRKVLKIA